MGNAGPVIIFVCLMVVLVYIGTYFLCYAAHCYFVTVQGTVAGLDRVEWPDEPVVDWLLQAISLLGLMSIWLVPVGFAANALRNDWLVGHGGLRVVLLAVPGFWLIFPVSLLSSLASQSRWQFVNGRVLAGLGRLLPALVVFYACTSVLVAVVAALVALALFSPVWYVLPLAAVAGTAGWLIHARLVGRLGWLLQEKLDPVPTSTPKKAGKRRKRSSGVEVQDPWADPEPAEEPAGPLGYQVVEKPVPKAPRPAYMDPEPDPYVMASEPEAVQAAPKLALNEAQVERELELRTRTPPNPPPRYPLFSGVYTFPAYRTTLRAWVWLAFWGLWAGTVARMVFLLFPF